MNLHKPTISLRKYDETQCINIRTHWSLVYSLRAGGSYNAADDAPTYELQVRHNAIEDSRVFISHLASERDELELLEQDEWNARILNIREHEDMSHEDAEAWLRERAAIMEPHEARIREHLNSTWEAFVLLFSPAYNL